MQIAGAERQLRFQYLSLRVGQAILQMLLEETRPKTANGEQRLAVDAMVIAQRYFRVRFAETTRIIASPEGPMFKVPTTTASPSRILISVLSPVFS